MSYQTGIKKEEQLKSQKDTDLRRHQAEKQRLVEENKALMIKNNALQLRVEAELQNNSSYKELQKVHDQLCVKYSRSDDELKVLRGSLSSAADRAREAELSYVEVKKQMTVRVIEKVLDWCQTDVFRLKSLQRCASEMSAPSVTDVRKTIEDLMTHCGHISNHKWQVIEVSEKCIKHLSAGRPLNNALRNSLLGLPEELLTNVSTNLLSLSVGGQVLHWQTLNAMPTLSPATKQQNQNTPKLNVASSNSGNHATLGATSAQSVDTSLGSIIKSNCGIERPAAVVPKSEFTKQVQSPRSSIYDHSQIPLDLQLFINNIPPTFTNSQLYRLLVQVAEISSVKIDESSNIPANGPKYGIIFFTNRLHKDALLAKVKRAPISHGQYIFNIRPVDNNLKRIFDVGKCTPSPHPAQTASNYDDNIELGLRVETKPAVPNMRQYSSATGAVCSAIIDPVKRRGVTSSYIPAPAAGASNFERLLHACMVACGNSNKELITGKLLEVRKRHNNKMSGIAQDVIIEEVRQLLQLPGGRSQLTPMQPAPWADAAQKEAAPIRKRDSPSSDEECSICFSGMDKPNTVRQLDCGHFFHANCINSWFEVNNNCPICRRHSINKKEFPSLKN